MLIKQFLNDREKNYILNFIKTIQEKDYTKIPGKDAYQSFMMEYKDMFNFIDYKIIKYNKNCQKSIKWENCFVVKIKPNGFLATHCDDLPSSCNILIQKPENGGHLLIENTKIIKDEKDAYFLNPHKKHGISTVIGNKCYYSVVICSKII